MGVGSGFAVFAGGPLTATVLGGGYMATYIGTTIGDSC